METSTAIIIGSVIMGVCQIAGSLMYSFLLWKIDDRRHQRAEALAHKTAECAP